MVRKLQFTSFVILISFAASITIAEPIEIINLRKTLLLTLQNNPELKAFSFEIKSAQARQLQAGLWPNPELAVEIEEFGGTGPRSGFDGAETTIQLSQLIELGDKSGKRKKVATIETKLAQLDYQDKKLEIFSDATKAYILLLKAQEKHKLAQELLELAEQSFEIVEKRVNAGKDPPLEIDRASVGLANAKMSYVQAQSALENARRNLVSFWGQDKALFEYAAGDLDRLKEIPVFEESFAQLKNNPRYIRWQSEIEKNQAVLDLEKSKTIGDITIGGGFQRFNETNDNAFVIGVSIPLPLSDRNQGNEQEARFNLAKAKHKQKAAMLNLQNEFNQKYQVFLNSYKKAESLKSEVVPAATRMFDAAKVAYQEGKVNYLNVLDAQRTLFEIKESYIETLSDYHIARTEIQRFTNSKLETLYIDESDDNEI